LILKQNITSVMNEARDKQLVLYELNGLRKNADETTPRAKLSHHFQT
jgi:hypothetical protein